MASQLQIDANRQNAQKSTGPKTPEGKAAISQNALTHGLTAENACINGEDKDEFDASLQSFQAELKPVGPLQTLLVEQIAMAAWRLPRVERSFYRALHELQRLQKEMAKQSQIAPEPQPQQDFTPPFSPSLVPLCLCGEPSPRPVQTG